MSRFDKGNPVKLDANGNLDTSILERELTAALEFDIRYKQQDNMKKKAVKTSGTYDDFKAMVACSHLKTLTSKEVESLSTKKQGWQREYIPSNIDGAHILMQEAKKSGIEEAKEIAIKNRGNTQHKSPKNLLFLERDICRTLKTNADRSDYLQAMGIRKLKSLLKGEKDCTPELLETLLEVILFSSTNGMEESLPINSDINDIQCNMSEIDNSQCAVDHDVFHSALSETTNETRDDTIDEASDEHGITVSSDVVNDRNNDNTNNDKKKSADAYRWIRAASSYSRFHITVMFLPKSLLRKRVILMW